MIRLNRRYIVLAAAAAGFIASGFAVDWAAAGTKVSEFARDITYRGEHRQPRFPREFSLLPRE